MYIHTYMHKYIHTTYANTHHTYTIASVNIRNTGRLKSLQTDRDSLIDCDQMRFIFEHSLFCARHTSVLHKLDPTSKNLQQQI